METKTKHTSGDWTVRNHTHGRLKICPEPGVTLAIVFRDEDADLIARAPKMDSALRVIRERLGIRNDFCPIGIALELEPIIRAALRTQS